MRSIIEWLGWNEEVLRDVYKEYVEKIEADHSVALDNINVLVLCKSRKGDDTKYKIMCSKMFISWTDGMCYSPPNNTPHVKFSLCNIAEFSVFGFCPMFLALPPEFKQ